MPAMRVLPVTPAFYPATVWGGPIQSLHGLCNALARLDGMEVRVLTTDTAGLSRSQSVPVTSYPMRYPAGYDVWFTRRRFGPSLAPRLFAELPSFVRWADVVHLTAVYSSPTLPTLALCRALGKPLAWSTRGSLQRWEGARNRPLKWAWELAARSLMDKKRTVLHFTSREEEEESRSRIPGGRSIVIANGIDIPELRARAAREPGTLRVLFLGRLHPIKAVENLIAAVASHASRTVSLTVAGGGEAAYVARLEQQVADLGLADRVRLVGPVEGEAKEDLFFRHDVLALPSHRENFGMVVLEALARGLPVIAARGTPWQALEDKRCGVWCENDPASLAQAFVRMEASDLGAMGAAARAWAAADFSWESAAACMASVYRELAERLP